MLKLFRDYEGRGYKSPPRGSPYRRGDKYDSGYDKRSSERSPRGGNYKNYGQRSSYSKQKSRSKSRSVSKSSRYSGNRGYDYKGKEAPRDPREEKRSDVTNKTYPSDTKKERNEPSAQPSKVVNTYRENEPTPKPQQYTTQSPKTTSSQMNIEKPLPEKRLTKTVSQPSAGVAQQGNIQINQSEIISKLFKYSYFLLFTSL